MAVKPIFTVKVDSAEFDAFAKKVADLKAAMESKSDFKLKDFSAEVAGVEQFAASIRAARQDQEKAGKSFVSSFSGALPSADKVASAAKGIASSLKDATKSLLSWAGIAGGILGLGGLGSIFAFDHLAELATGYRKSAGGIGVSPAQEQSFKVNYSQVVDDPRALLARTADLQGSLEGRTAFLQMGIQNPAGMDPAALAQAAMVRAKQIVEKYGLNDQVASAFGLDQEFSMADLRRLQATPYRDLASAARRENEDKTLLERLLGPDKLKKWTEFYQQLDRSSVELKAVFISGLVKFSGPLEKLSASFTHAIDVFVNSEMVGKAITWVTDKLSQFARWISTPEFEADIKGFAQWIKDAAAAAWEFAKKLGWMLGFNTTGSAATNNLESRREQGHLGVKPDLETPLGSAGGPTQFSQIEKENKLPYGTLWNIYGAESSYGKDPGAFTENSAGAKGPFQFIPQTAKDYGLIDEKGNDYRNDTKKEANAAGVYLHDLFAKFGAYDKSGNIASKEGLEEGLAAYNMGPSAVAALVARYHGEWLNHASQGVQDYVRKTERGLLGGANQPLQYLLRMGQAASGLRIGVNVNNNTGGSAIVTANQMVPVG